MTLLATTTLVSMALAVSCCSSGSYTPADSSLPKPEAAKTRQAVQLLRAIYVVPDAMNIDPRASELSPTQSRSTLTARLEQIRRARGNVAFTFDEVKAGNGTVARFRGILNRETGSVVYRGNKPNYGKEPIQLWLLGNFSDPRGTFSVLRHEMGGMTYEHFRGGASESKFVMTRTGRIGEWSEQGEALPAE